MWFWATAKFANKSTQIHPNPPKSTFTKRENVSDALDQSAAYSISGLVVCRPVLSSTHLRQPRDGNRTGGHRSLADDGAQAVPVHDVYRSARFGLRLVALAGGGYWPGSGMDARQADYRSPDYYLSRLLRRFASHIHAWRKQALGQVVQNVQ